MTKKELAEKLNGCAYGTEAELIKSANAKEHGLVVVYGYSDDNMEFEGAISAEMPCYEGGTVYITNEGRIVKKKTSNKIRAIWGPSEPDCSWVYETPIPHETFNVNEDGELYCVGIVFHLSDLK